MYAIGAILCAGVALILMIIGLVPLLGWINWFAIFFAAMAMGLGVVSRKPEVEGQPPSGAVGCVAIFMALGIMAVSLVRLAIGGGIV